MKTSETLARFAHKGRRHSHWYHHANIAITQLCEANGWDAAVFIEVLAVTSPRIQVKKNWDATVHYMLTGELPRYIMRSTRAAMAHWEETREIRGPKTGAFSDAIKGDEDALVLDVWMARALGIDERKVTRKDNMEAARRRVKRVAKAQGWTVAECQAAIWCGIMLDQNIWPTTFEWAASGQMSLNRNGTMPLF